VFACLIAGLAQAASAQLIQAPPGSDRGIFGGGPAGPGSPGLSTAFELNAGFDDNAVPETESPEGGFTPFQSGYVGSATGSLRYQRGRAERYVLTTGLGSISQQQVAVGQDFYRLYRGEASVQAASGLGGRSGVTAGLTAGYEPTYVFGAFDSLDLNIGVENPLEDNLPPTADPAISMTAQRWLTNVASASVYRNWSARQRTSVEYSGLWVQPTSGPGFDSQTHSAAVVHSWAAWRTSGIELAYRYNRNAQTIDDVASPPLEMHSAEAQVRHERRLSTNRTITFMGAAGVVAMADRTLRRRTPDRFLPLIGGSVELRFLPMWSVSLSGRHDVSMLSGLTAEPFESDAAMLTVTGTAWRRLTFATTGGYSRGRAPGAAPGDYDQKIVNAQLTYGFATRYGLLAGYAYNTHRFEDVALGPTAFPTEFGRHSVRVGLTMWFPLYGSF
jgi:hypothetical protein